MMARFPLVAATVVLACVTFACGRNRGSLPSALSAVSVTNLVTDVRNFISQADTNEWTWEGKDPRLPQTVRRLTPIRVTLDRSSSPNMVEIKLGGGFFPNGFLITCGTNVAYTNKLHGNGWQVTRITDDLYEYRGY